MIEYVNAIARLWWDWTAAMFWQVSLLVVLIACIDRLARRWAWPHLRYALWSLILIKLILPPTLSLPSGAVPQLAPVVGQAVRWKGSEKSAGAESPILRALHENAAAVAVMEPVPPARAGFVMVESRGSVEGKGLQDGAVFYTKSHPQASLEAATPPPSNPQFSWQFYAMATWLAGTLLLGTWLLLRLHSLVGRHTDRAAETSLPQSFYSHLAGCAERLGLRHVPRVIVVRQLATPAVFGVFRPVLLMPRGYLSKLSRRDTEHMLLHELAHIRRGDLHAHGLYMLLQVLYWYNPLLWLVRRQLHHLRELSCDATVAELLRERTKAYRQTLLETARRFLATSTEPGLGLLGLFEDANRLVVRLNWLEKPTWRYRTMKRVIVLAVAALMFACVLPMAQGQDSTPPVAENKSTNQIEEKTPSSQELADLQVRLERLEVERQKLQKDLQALEQARQKATEAQAQSVEAGKEAEKAKDAVAKVRAKAKEARAQAMDAYQGTEEFQQWAMEMQAWQKAMDEWQSSDEWKQWQEDVQKWGQEYGDAFGKAYGGAEGSAGVLPDRPVPPMPAMPAMPAPPAQPAPHPAPMPVSQIHVSALPKIHTPDVPHVNADIQRDDGKAKATETMSFTSPLVDGGLLIVKNRVGAVSVHGGETDECRVDVRVTAKAGTEEEARAKAEVVKMKMDTSERRFSIEPVKPDNENWSGLDVTFEITVPRRTNLEITADVGAVQLRDVQGQIKVKANVGGIKTENVRGDIELETNVGDVDFIAPADLSTRLAATTNVGSIKSDLPIEVRSIGNPGSGGVNLSLGKTAVGTLGAGEGTVKLKSNVGSISVRSKASADKPAKVRTSASSQATLTGDGSVKVNRR
ncbi:M56 family metallopeptidase [Anaerobaca lacustris]|uniref:M56 family metallopeptidase n=1 Tax=Anaerobaca lacustris TaxID=3044600 RepID=A0AAW6U4F6_9BACT|nr:M56 family metallopeptidase [Sedimentisphaerales bacterium M17dextr]